MGMPPVQEGHCEGCTLLDCSVGACREPSVAMAIGAYACGGAMAECDTAIATVGAAIDVSMGCHNPGCTEGVVVGEGKKSNNRKGATPLPLVGACPSLSAAALKASGPSLPPVFGIGELIGAQAVGG